MLGNWRDQKEKQIKVRLRVFPTIFNGLKNLEQGKMSSTNVLFAKSNYFK